MPTYITRFDMTRIHDISRRLLPVLAALCIMMLGGCKDKQASAIDTMVDTLNSPAMQVAEKATGLFTGSNAKINGDSLIIVFEMKPELSLKNVDTRQLPVLQQSAVTEFRMHAASNAEFAEGLKALAESGMIMVLKWHDTDGHTVQIDVPAADLKQ